MRPRLGMPSPVGAGPDDDPLLAVSGLTTAFPVEGRLVPAVDAPGSWHGSLMVGSNWWEPDPEALVAAIRAAIDGLPQPTGARERIRARFTETDSAAALLDALAGGLPAR